ncbi:MAG: NAD(P)(+) transhydrogenase (Re/Si-specific) subunit beta [Candidatus Dormibacteraeota bacterium]|nr:NAD(P)(+) transhydrogenase (Re/Si-specific) subunit beta [Candidatus Dormibacteraeota bacterium]
MTAFQVVTALVYLLAAVLFIVGLRFLSSPRSARRGNQVAAAGMVIAVLWTVILLRNSFTAAGVAVSVAGFALGATVGTVGARRVKMTAIPQMVALFNGVGGGAAALVAVSELLLLAGGRPDLQTGLPSAFAIIVGGISFAGSAIAFAKLQELMTGTPITYPGQQAVNGIVALAIVVLAVVLLGFSGRPLIFVALLLLALVLGVAFVLPIGGADMPVVISILNAFTGLAVAASGFVLDNFALIVAGTLVGASGSLLTKLMGDAMGRSLSNVLFGAFGQVQGGAGDIGGAGGDRSVRAGSSDDIATMLAYSRKVIIVPGYGLAVAQAQHVVRELVDELERRGVEVEYAIHPVAGRMPGHMNVLLAEANVPYEQLREMDEINGEFRSTDVALVVGANDVVNPAARSSPGSPIYGMPILNVDDAQNIVFLKRSMRPGFAGIDNELLYDSKTIMLFGDAKDSLTKLVASVKAA